MASINISASSVAKLLAAAIGALVLLDALALIARFYFGYNWVFGLVPRFALDNEGNVPTWYSSMALLVAAGLLAIVALDPRNERWRRHWAVLAAGFVYLSLDELAQLHELIGMALDERIDNSGLLRWPWVIPGVAGAAVLAFAYWPFLVALPARSRKLFIVAGVIYLGGAIGIEMITGWWYDQYGEESLGYSLIGSIEETFEMTGIAIFIYALVGHLHSQGIALRVAFDAHPKRAAVPQAKRSVRESSSGAAVARASVK